MSVEYFFYNKPLSRKALLEDTDFTIENHNGSDWIIDKDVANIRIKSAKDDEIYELEDHGFKDIHNIMDTIVEKYKITFYTDNEMHNYYQLQHHNRQNKPFPYPDMLNADGEFDFKAAVCRDMRYFGEYVVLDVIKGEVVIPQRNEQTTMEDEQDDLPKWITNQDELPF